MALGDNPTPNTGAFLSQTGSTATSDTLPAWLQDYTRSTLAEGTGIYGQTYQPYTDPRVADIGTNANIQAGFTGVQANQGAWQPYTNTASQTLPGGITSYMNPYTTNVVNEQARLSNENLFNTVLPQVNSTFAGAGQFGSTRNADFTNRAISDQTRNLTGAQGNTLQQGWNTAGQQFLSDMQRQQSLGKDVSALGYQDAQQLQGIGKQEWTQQQQGLDLNYQQFLEARDYPKVQLEFMNNLIRGLPTTKSGFTTSTAVPNPYALAGSTGTSAAEGGLNALTKALQQIMGGGLGQT